MTQADRKVVEVDRAGVRRVVLHKLGDELHFGRAGGDGAIGHQGDPLVGDIGQCGDGGDFVGAHLDVCRVHVAESEVEGATTGHQVNAEDLGCAAGVDGLTR